MKLLFNVGTEIEEHSDLLMHDKSETLSHVMLQEPFFKWVTDHPDALNEKLVEALAMMLLPLKKEGELFLVNLAALTDKHQHLASRIMNIMNTNKNNCLIGGVFNYDMLGNIGYTGTFQIGDPVSSSYI